MLIALYTDTFDIEQKQSTFQQIIVQRQLHNDQ